MSKDNLKLTSVKIDDELFEEFKINSIRFKTSLQRVVNRTLDLYNKDEKFREIIHNHNELIDKGNL
jgi:hypothetical protein